MQEIIISDERLEKFILSKLISNRGELPPKWLKDIHFSDPLNQRLFSVWVKLLSSGSQINISSVYKSYKDEYGIEDKIATTITDYQLDFSLNSYGLEPACKRLRELYTVRKIKNIWSELHGMPKSNPLEFVMTEVSKIATDSYDSDSKDVLTIATEALNEAEEIRNSRLNNEPIPNAVYSGFTDIDRDLGLMRAGDLVIIAARPSMGKSTLVRNMITAMAKQFPVKLYTLEMQPKQVISLMGCTESGVNYHHIRTGSIGESDLKKYTQGLAQVSKLNLEIEIISTLTDLIISVTRWRMTTDMSKPAVLVVDYLQQVLNEMRNRSRTEEIGGISRALKQLAVDQNLLVIGVAQLSRSVEVRGGDKRPIMSDINESGKIEQDADTIMFLYRPEYYGFETDDEGRSTKGLAEVIIAKARYASRDAVRLQFIGSEGKFEAWKDELFHKDQNRVIIPNIERNEVPF